MDAVKKERKIFTGEKKPQEIKPKYGLNQDRIQVQFRIYDKETLAYMRDNGVGNQWFKEQLRKAMRKNEMTADGKAAVICSVLANHPGKTYEQIIELSSRIIASAEEMV